MTTIPFAHRISCTIPEACEATGLGRTKLYEEMDSGRVETTTVGRRRLVLVRSLLHLIDPAPAPRAGASSRAAEQPTA